MSEKRFILDELYCYVIQDNKKRLTDKQVVDLLNEQQLTISALKEENEEHEKESEDMQQTINVLYHEVLMAKEQIFNCNNCKYHKDEKRDDLEHFSYPYSYCERKRCRLGSRERNWEGSWEQCRYTCFVPNEQTKRYIYNSLLMDD